MIKWCDKCETMEFHDGSTRILYMLLKVSKDYYYTETAWIVASAGPSVSTCILSKCHQSGTRQLPPFKFILKWWGRWLDGDEAKPLYSSSSFWKGALPPYRETIDHNYNSIASPNSFHSIEDDGERDGNQSTQDDMILSNSIVNLNIK